MSFFQKVNVTEVPLQLFHKIKSDIYKNMPTNLCVRLILRFLAEVLYCNYVLFDMRNK